MSFFKDLNYSSCNEDWRTEAEALRVGPDDRVLCVTGSGDRPLNLLLARPASVTAIDLNPAQNHLLRLKISAMRCLPYDEYCQFLGLADTNRREELFAPVRQDLEPESNEFWGKHRRLIRAGVLYQGRWERHFRRLARLSALLRRHAIRQLFSFDRLEEQRRFVRTRWDRPWWRLMYQVTCSRPCSRVLFRDPAFYRHVLPRMSVGGYLYDAMLASLDRCLARKNFMLSLVFRGRLSEEDLPPYLSGAGFDPIRRQLGKISIVTAELVGFLRAAPPGAFTRFSLSDVPSFLDQSGFEKLLVALVHAAAPGSRFCIRQFLSGHAFPAALQSTLACDERLERRLRSEDHSFAYRFLVGEVRHHDCPVSIN